MRECGRRAGAASLPAPRSTDRAEEEQRRNLDSGSTAVGSSSLLPDALLDLETAGGPQQGTGMRVQEPFCFWGGESMGCFTPDRSLRSISQTREQVQREQ